MASKWIWAFLGGTAVGAAVAHLAMPNSGKENREDIAPAVNKGAVSGKEKTQDFTGESTG
jgi:gas vesicle protein